MAKRIMFKQSLRKVVAPCLRPLGYELTDLPGGWAGIGSFLFRKLLFEDIYSFVSFELRSWHPPPPDAPPWPRSFNVILWRNRGDQPRVGHGTGEHLYENWLQMPLGQLLWVVLGVKVYSWQYHEWQFSTPEELEAQLQDATETFVRYGLPWLEDPASKNPYPSYPSPP